MRHGVHGFNPASMPGAHEYLQKHRPRQLAGIRVLQRRMIAGDCSQSAGQVILGSMRKNVIGAS